MSGNEAGPLSRVYVVVQRLDETYGTQGLESLQSHHSSGFLSCTTSLADCAIGLRSCTTFMYHSICTLFIRPSMQQVTNDAVTRARDEDPGWKT